MLATMLTATLPTRTLYWLLSTRNLSQFWWLEVVKELARRGKVESVEVVDE